MEQGTFMDLIRMFFAFLDGIIYNLIGDAHNLVVEIAHYKVFESVEFFANKIYAILGIFMLFKVSFSFINYLINPDSFTDKEKGVQHVIKNIIIMFIMLISCPWAFKTLWTLQANILDEGIIENFIFGDEDRKLREYKMMDSCSEYSKAASNGDYIALMVLKGFYKPYTATEIGYSISGNEYSDTYDDVKKILCTAVNNGTPTIYLTSDVYNASADVDGFSLFWIGDKDIYIMDYKIIISTAIGVVVLLILISFALDVGARVIKLSFLELLAPVPIVSYIDPASGKNGMFKKWLKEVGATWASVFIRLLALYFAVRVIQEVGSLQHVTDPTKKPSVWVIICVIIGALMFAKQLPKLIQNITGINFDGGFTLNPMKKIRDNALGGKLVAGTATGAAAGGLAFAGGAAANAWSAHKNNAKARATLEKEGITKDNPEYKQRFKEEGGRTAFGYAGTMFAGGASSAARAAAKGKDGKFHPLKNAQAGIKESSAARNQRADGIGFLEQSKRTITATAGIKDEYGLYGKNDARIKELRNLEAELHVQEEYARKVQTEYLSKTSYTVEAFREGFRRDPEGMGARIFDSYAGNSDYDKYINYMNKLNQERVNKGQAEITVINDRAVFDEYNKYEHNSHYLNVEHEKVKKDLSRAEKLFADKNKKG